MATKTKRLSQHEIRANVVEFAAEWADETYEQGEATSFWTDLFVFAADSRGIPALFHCTTAPR